VRPGGVLGGAKQFLHVLRVHEVDAGAEEEVWRRRKFTFNAVQRIAETVGTAEGPIICGVARDAAGDIKACADAVAPAVHRRIHTFIATSDIHLEHKLRKSRAEVLAITLSRLLHVTMGDVITMINILIFSAVAMLLSIETAMYSLITYLAASRTMDFVIEGG
jgi:hypothetical protein